MKKHRYKIFFASDLFPGDVLKVRQPGYIIPTPKRIKDISWTYPGYLNLHFENFNLSLKEDEFIPPDCYIW